MAARDKIYLNGSYDDYKVFKNWLEKQSEHLENYDEAEKEKADFVGDGFIECHADFLDFKEGNTYWLEYIGDDRYNVRSDNLLGKTYHITPCQLYTIFKKLTWLEKQGESIKIKKGKNYLCTKTHKYAGVEWIEGVKYYSPENYSLVNQGCTCYCPKYSKEEHNNLFEEVKYNDCVEKQGKNMDLPNVTDRNTLDEYAYQVAYDLSNDWLKDTPTWDDVERACKLGAKWYEAHHKVRWSEEDKDFMYDTLSNLAEVKGRYGEGYGNVGKCIDWLKSLKDRVQPKQEWSVEDKLMLMSCIEIMQTVDSTEEQQNWLKSLRPQNKWRPSEEQIACLHDAVARYNREGFSAATLASLLEQLKKLKG